VGIVVSDTSPIRALNHLGLLELLNDIYGVVLIPTEVANELLQPSRRFPSFDVRGFPFLNVRSPGDAARVISLRTELGAGESAAIVLAIEMKAEYLLIDERQGRMKAHRMGLEVVGVLGVLKQAKHSALVSQVGPLIERLQRELDFFVSKRLIEQVMRDVGE
jgi:predicted nucleic acid-binding protein